MFKHFYLLLFFMFSLFPLISQQILEEEWIRFPIEGRSMTLAYGASSVLDEASRYNCQNAFDMDPETAWVEGIEGAGIGESIWIGVKELPEALGFINGYAKSRSLFRKNHRLHELDVVVYVAVHLSGFANERASYYDGKAISQKLRISLDDSRSPQSLSFPFRREQLMTRMNTFKNSHTVRSMTFPQAKEMGIARSQKPEMDFLYIIQLSIVSVYEGSSWEDSCLAEIWADYGPIEEIHINSDGHGIILRDSFEQEVPVYTDSEGILSIVELSESLEWALLLREPATAGEGRIESSYILLHLPSGRDLGSRIPGLQEGRIIPYSFIEKRGISYLQYIDLENDQEAQSACLLYLQ